MLTAVIMQCVERSRPAQVCYAAAELPNACTGQLLQLRASFTSCAACAWHAQDQRLLLPTGKAVATCPRPHHFQLQEQDRGGGEHNPRDDPLGDKASPTH